MGRERDRDGGEEKEGTRERMEREKGEVEKGWKG